MKPMSNDIDETAEKNGRTKEIDHRRGETMSSFTFTPSRKFPWIHPGKASFHGKPLVQGERKLSKRKDKESGVKNKIATFKPFFR